MEGQMSAGFLGDIQTKITDEERIRIRDAMSEEERWERFEAHRNRSVLRSQSGKVDDVSRIEARLEQIEKRLETLELKQ